ncbi:hypothetical protein ACOME3_003502 [Neoechinorhynchus agilis]
MEQMLTSWTKSDIISRILTEKLIFVESDSDGRETALALHNYRRACSVGRGALFFCVARGRVAEGVDFDNHFGRCAIMIGMPFQFTKSTSLHCRLQYIREQFNISENEFLTFDAMRHAAQCAGRVMRNKFDYGLMVFADSRFMRSDKRNKLPRWILEKLSLQHVNLSTNEAKMIAKRWLREIAQPDPHIMGNAVLTEDHLKDEHILYKLENG